MPQITVHADCENASNKQLLRDLNIAFAKADVQAIMPILSDDIHWHIVGEVELRGADQVRDALMQMQDVSVRELVIDSIITDGRQGAISGTVIPEYGNQVAFCDICQFASGAGGRIKSMKSYTIEIKREH